MTCPSSACDSVGATIAPSVPCAHAHAGRFPNRDRRAPPVDVSTSADMSTGGVRRSRLRKRPAQHERTADGAIIALNRMLVAAIERVLDRPGAGSSCPCAERGVAVELAPELVLPYSSTTSPGAVPAPSAASCWPCSKMRCMPTRWVACRPRRAADCRPVRPRNGSARTTRRHRSPSSRSARSSGLDPTTCVRAFAAGKTATRPLALAPGHDPLRIRHVSGSRHHVTAARSPASRMRPPPRRRARYPCRARRSLPGTGVTCVQIEADRSAARSPRGAIPSALPCGRAPRATGPASSP
jgi:hypothetical protein